MRHFCAVADEKRGLAVLVRGLPECEILPDRDNAIALTLLRTTRVMIPKIKAVDPMQDGTQQLGPQVFEYAVMPFGGAGQIPQVRARAFDYALPMRSAQLGRQNGHLPLESSFLSVSAPFEVSAVKRSQNGESVVVRLWNTSLEQASGVLRTGFDVDQAWLTNLAEERCEPIDVTSRRQIRLAARPRHIMTLELSVARPPQAAHVV
jgi:alpha-mannosidase